MKKLTAFIPAFLCFSFIYAQDFQWWANAVKWDGVTSWRKYLIYSPYYMGPNALPVPRIPNGKIDSVHSIGISGNVHFMKGDITINPSIYASYVLVKDVISFDIMNIPYEYFDQSHDLKTERHVYYYYYNSHSAYGDIILNTKIQLLKKLQPKINLMLRMGYRFATSTNYAAARYTDAPGYNFDINTGIPFGKNKRWLLKAMAGLYTWQVNEERYEQNDAFLFGAGTEYHHKKFSFDFSAAGYLGYLKGRRDKPIVLRIGFEHRLKNAAVTIRAQQGIHDFKYSSFETGYRYIIKVKSNKR
jgi:hypothetical protein